MPETGKQNNGKENGMAVMADTTIKVEFDPQQPLPPRYVGSTEDGPQYEPVTLLDAVVETAAEKLLARVVGNDQKRLSKLVEDRLNEEVDRLVGDLLPGIVQDALGGEIVATTEFGRETFRGSLRDRMVEHARSQLIAKEGRYGNEGTVLAKVVKDEIDYKLKGELKKAVDAAKSELLDRLRASAADVLAKTVADAMRERTVL